MRRRPIRAEPKASRGNHQVHGFDEPCQEAFRRCADVEGVGPMNVSGHEDKAV